MTVAVIGIGQSMRADDAAGLEAVRLWKEVHPETAGRPDVRVAIVEGPGLDLLDLLDGMDSAVLVDAVRSSAPAGTLHHIGPEALLDVRHHSVAAHGWGLAEVLRLARVLDPESLPPAIRLLGIEAASVHVGEGLSEPVQGALPAACETIQSEVATLLKA